MKFLALTILKAAITLYLGQKIQYDLIWYSDLDV